MKEFKTAPEVLAADETALCLFTRGDDLEMRPDGTSSSGYWKLNAPRTVDRVLIYLRDDERPDVNEIFIHLLPAFLLVLIDHGYAEDWGALCYPPLTD